MTSKEHLYHLRHSDQNEVAGRIFDEGVREFCNEVNRVKEILQSGYHPPPCFAEAATIGRTLSP